MGAEKQASATRIYEADRLLIRPHHLMCMTCFHGGREELAPIAADNLFEAIDVIHKRPEIPITLVRGCCMISPALQPLRPRHGPARAGMGMNLRDQKKDLDVLQKLGLSMEDTLPARELLELLYERIPSTRDVCGYGDGKERAWEWRICGEPEAARHMKDARGAGSRLSPTPKCSSECFKRSLLPGGTPLPPQGTRRQSAFRRQCPRTRAAPRRETLFHYPDE